MKVHRHTPKMPNISVCCVISETLGNIYNHYIIDNFQTSKDMCEVLRAIRERMGPEIKTVLFWDNASHHRSKEIKKFAA